MGLLDCCGTFLAAMGAFYTPGQVQTLLNQTLIPVTMLASFLYLRTRFSFVQLLGAALVLLGALVVVCGAAWRRGGCVWMDSWHSSTISFRNTTRTSPEHR